MPNDFSLPPVDYSQARQEAMDRGILGAAARCPDCRAVALGALTGHQDNCPYPARLAAQLQAVTHEQLILLQMERLANLGSTPYKGTTKSCNDRVIEAKEAPKMTEIAQSALITPVLGLVTYSALRRQGPVRLLVRGLVYARAAYLMVGVLTRICWAHRDRWQECVEAAWRER